VNRPGRRRCTTASSGGDTASRSGAKHARAGDFPATREEEARRIRKAGAGRWREISAARPAYLRRLRIRRREERQGTAAARGGAAAGPYAKSLPATELPWRAAPKEAANAWFGRGTEKSSPARWLGAPWREQRWPRPGVGIPSELTDGEELWVGSATSFFFHCSARQPPHNAHDTSSSSHSPINSKEEKENHQNQRPERNQNNWRETEEGDGIKIGQAPSADRFRSSSPLTAADQGRRNRSKQARFPHQ
jgi:hypothetical protein